MEMKEKSWLKKTIVLSAEDLACWLGEPSDVYSKLGAASNDDPIKLFRVASVEVRVSSLLNKEIS